MDSLLLIKVYSFDYSSLYVLKHSMAVINAYLVTSIKVNQKNVVTALIQYPL